MSDDEVFGAPHYAAPVGGEFGDLSAQPWAQGQPVPEGKVAPVAKIVGAMGEGWQATPSIATPDGEQLINRLSPFSVPIGSQIINPALKILNVPFAAGNALMYGGAELANQVTGDPRAGRDVLMAGQVAPMARIGPGVAPVEMAAGTRVNPLMDTFNRAEAMRADQPSRPDPVASNIARVQSQIGVRPEPPAPVGMPADTAPPGIPPGTDVPTLLRLRAAINAVPEEAPPGFVPPTEREPSVPPGAAGPATVAYAPPTPEAAPTVAPPGPEDPPGPRSVGAAASRDMTQPASMALLTPEEEALYGSTADKQWLYKSMQPGVADNTEYVPGITPTMAQREQTVQAARETKAARNLSPTADQAERELLDEHNTIRKNEYQNVAGSDVTQGLAIDAAEKQIDDALGRAFNAGGTVDNGPIAGAIQAELNAPSGKLPPVKAVMSVVSDALRKSDGSGLESDPTQVYGVRRVINYLQSKNAIAENPAYGSPDVQAALIRVKNAIDAQMEPAAPGFGDAIGNYARARQAIDANEALQKAEPKLYDDKGRMQYSRFHRFMNEVVQSRDPRAPLNPYQSFTDAQMNRLKSLHDDLLRVASAEDLAKAKGSDTAMNFMDAVKEAAQGVPGTLAAGVAGHVIGGPAGIVMGPAIKQGVQGIFTRRAERAATEKMGRLLRPDPVRYPTRRNPLMNPDDLP